MANKTVKGLVIELSADSTKVKRAFDALETQAKATQRSLNEVNRALKLDPKNAELAKQKIRLLGESIGQTKDKLTQLKEAESAAMQALASGKIDQGQFEALRREIIKTEQKLGSLKSELETSGGGWNKFTERAEQASQKLKGISEKLTSVGTSLSKYVTAPLVGVGYASQRAYKEIDESLDTIIKKTGATGDAAKGLEQSFKNVFKSIPTDSAQAAAAIGDINTHFALTGEQLERTSTLFLEFAKINDFDVTAAVEGAKGAIDRFGLSADALPSLLDAVTYAGQATGANLQKVFDGLQRGAADFKALGLSAEESALLLGKLSQSGVEINQIFPAIGHAANAAAQEGKSLSMAFQEFSQYARSTASESDKLQASIALFGSQNSRLMLDLFKEGRFELGELSGELGNASGVVQTTFNEVVDPMDRAGVAFQSLKVAGAELFEKLAPTIEQIAGVITKAVDAFNSLSPSTQEAIVKFGLFAAAAGPVVGATGKIVGGIGDVVGVAGKLASKIPSIASSIGGITSAASAAAPAMGGISTALSGVGSTLLSVATGPVGAAVAGVGAAIGVGYLIYENWDEISGFLSDTWNGIKETASAAWDGITSFLSDTWNGIKDTASDIWDGVTGFFSDTWNGIKDTASAAWDGITGFFSDTWNGIKDTASDIWDGVTGFFSDTWDGIKDTASAAWDGITGFFSDTWNGIKDTASDIWDGVTGFFSDTWDSIKDTASDKWEGVKSFFSDTWKGIKDTAGDIWGGVKSFFSDTWDNIKKTAGDKWDKIKTTVSDKFTSLSDKVTNIHSSIKTGLSNAWESIKKTASDKWGRIKTAVTDKLGELEKSADAHNTNMGSLFSRAWDGIKNAAKSAWNWVTSFFRDNPVEAKVNTNTTAKTTKSAVGSGGVGASTLEWYDVGGVFNRPAVIGVGERRPEFVGALDDLRRIVREESKGTGGVVVTGNTFVVRQEADIDKIATELARKMQRARGAFA